MPDGDRAAPAHHRRWPRRPGIRLVASKSHRTRDVDHFRRALAIEDEVNVGSVGLKVAMVADARRDLYVYPGSRTKLWDTCAPRGDAASPPAAASPTSTASRWTTPSPTCRTARGIVARNGPLHDLVIQALQPLVASRKLPG